MRIKCLCMASLLLVVAVLSACAPADAGQEETTTQSPQTTTTQEAVITSEPIEETTPPTPATLLHIVENGRSAFKLVRGHGSSEEIDVASILLRKKIQELTGVNVSMITDWNKDESAIDHDAPEILIGVTNRSASREFKESLSGYCFGIKITDRQIIISATHEDFIPLAMDYFMERILTNEEYVTVSEGTLTVSSAASVICHGELADLIDIKSDMQYATVSELAGNLVKSGNFKALQGGCVTEDYAYMAVLNTTDYDTKDAGCYIYKLNTKTWKIVKRSEVLMLAHANDITYDPEKHLLYVAHCYVDNTKISIIDADTLKLVGTIHTDAGIYALDYHPATKTFVGGQGKSGTIFFKYSPDGKRLLTYGRIPPTSTQMITQGICRDDKYVYHVMYTHDVDEPYNAIIIYDLETREFVQYIRLSISGQEPENISLVDGVFYIGCNSSTSKLDIYKSVLYEFDFNDCEKCPT